jgi:hypothetical protein
MVSIQVLVELGHSAVHTIEHRQCSTRTRAESG